MSTIVILIIGCTLSYFFPQYRIQSLSKITILLDFILKKITNRVLLIAFIVLFSFIFPLIILHMVLQFSLIAHALLSIIFTYHLVRIPTLKDFMRDGSADSVNNSNTIIQSVVCFVDSFFIPCFCFALGALPLALLFMSSSHCSKKSIVSKNQSLETLIKIQDVLYFIPSYAVVLALLATSIFFPFCNTKNAYAVLLNDKKKIVPHWLSRILSTCFGLLCVEVPITYTLDGTEFTQTIGNTSKNINGQIVKSLVYILYGSSIVIITMLIIFRLIVTWGVW